MSDQRDSENEYRRERLSTEHKRILRQKRRRQRIMKAYIARTIFALIVVSFILIIFTLGKLIYSGVKKSETMSEIAENVTEVFDKEYTTVTEKPELKVDLLTINPYSRVGEALPEIKSIFVHYTANINTTAAQNKSYFENLKDTHETSASAHFIIGIDGEIVQCIPTYEVAYAVKGRNYDSLSIECCYASSDGKFSSETYNSLIKLLGYLVTEKKLQVNDILRHYDDNGKICPLYYVEHEDQWEQLKKDVEEYIEACQNM